MATNPDNATAGTAESASTASTDDLEENGGFSLADLADLDVSDIEEVRFESLPAGTYDFTVQDTGMVEDPKDGEERFKITFEFKIKECRSTIEAGVDRDSLKDRTHTERFFIYPKRSREDTAKAIGRIRAFVKDLGLNNEGTLGAIIADAKGHTFTAKITKRPNKEDPQSPFATLKLEPRR